MTDLATTAPNTTYSGSGTDSNSGGSAVSVPSPTVASVEPSTPPASNRKTALADAIRSHFSGDAPLTEKAKGFAKARPWTSAAFVGVAAIALLNTFRGRR